MVPKISLIYIEMYPLFFSLIRLSIGSSDTLCRNPFGDEWDKLYRMAVKQSLVGVCFAGGKRYMNAAQQRGETSNIPHKLYYQWLGTAVQIQQRNELMNTRCVELQFKLSSSGFTSSILKGQGVAALYGELKDLRQPGDIDVYVDCGREKAIEYARSIGQGNIDWDYKHLHLKVFKDTEVEMHYRPEVLLNLVKNRRLKRWFRSDEVQKQIFQQNGEIITPSVVFNLFYILLHIYRHFLYEGVGLRQLMDYYFVLRTTNMQDDKSKSLAAIEAFGMKRFAKGVMWIMQHVFGLEEQYLLYEPDETEGRYILNQVMAGGNFGHYDERLKTNKSKGKFGAVSKILKHNLHLLSRYPADVIWAPVWIGYHWVWKRVVK